MSRSSRRRGFEYERELARRLWEEGFACIRAPASGARVRSWAQPDIVAMRNGRILVFEVKTRRRAGTIYIEQEQYRKLVEFAERAGGLAFIAVKILDGRGWRFIPAANLEATPAGRIRVSREDIEKGLRLRDIVLMTERGVRKIEEYLKG